MPAYVDGFVLVLPKKNVEVYPRIARKACKIWMEHGALEYRECIGDDLDTKMGVPFPRQMGAQRGETVVFSWITYRSRAHRDRVNGEIMKDPRMAKMMETMEEMPFDCNRMLYGGFKTLVEAKRAARSKRSR